MQNKHVKIYICKILVSLYVHDVCMHSTYILQSMKMVADNGEWSKMFVDALKAYESDNFEGALLRYLLLGELGYEKAQSNAAHILETYTLKFVSGDEENSRRALMMWKRAAAQGGEVGRLCIADQI